MTLSCRCKISVFILSCKFLLGNTSDILMKDNFHLVCMEDKQALDHLSPKQKAGAEWQKQIVLVERHSVFPTLMQYLWSLLHQLELWALCMVQKQSQHTVLTIQACQHQGGQILACLFTHSKPNGSVLGFSWTYNSHFSNLSTLGYHRCTNWSGIIQQPDV